MKSALQVPIPASGSSSERIPVVALLRVSSAGQGADDRGGLPRQREIVNRTLATKNLNCVDWIELVDVSGTNTLTHPTIRDVLRRILIGEVRGLVVADIDRLFRPTEPANFAMLQVFRDVGAKIYSGDTEYDLTTKDGMLFSSIRSAFAGFELNLMKERQMGACESKRKAGKCPTNHLTLPMGIGYDRKTETWHYTPDIGRVTELFRLFDGGLTNYSELGRRFGFGPATVKVILRNPVYTGWRIIDKRRGAKKVSKNGKVYREKVDRPETETVRVKILDGVVSQETFDRVQATMKRTAYNHMESRKQDEAVNLGTGIAYCAHCGQPLFCSSGKQKGKPRKGFYSCRANYYLYRKRLGGCKQCHIKQPDLDMAISALVTSIIKSPKHLAAIVQSSIDRFRNVVTPIAPQVNPTQHIEELRKRDKRVLTAYEEGVITIDELRTKREELRRSIEALEKLAKPQAKPEDSQILKFAKSIIKAALRFPKLADPLQKKKIIVGLLSEVHVRDKTIIGFKFREAVLPTEAFVSEGNPTITLPNPIPIGPHVETLPLGKKRCIKCQEVKDASQFYRRLNSCDPCRWAQLKERAFLRKATAKKATE